VPKLPTDPNEYLTTQQVDDQYKALNQRTLELMRSKTKLTGQLYGPEWEQITARKVMYIRYKVDKYLASCTVTALNAAQLENKLEKLRKPKPQEQHLDATILSIRKRSKKK
jgi:hypothetical protein